MREVKVKVLSFKSMRHGPYSGEMKVEILEGKRKGEIHTIGSPMFQESGDIITVYENEDHSD